MVRDQALIVLAILGQQNATSQYLQAGLFRRQDLILDTGIEVRDQDGVVARFEWQFEHEP